MTLVHSRLIIYSLICPSGTWFSSFSWYLNLLHVKSFESLWSYRKSCCDLRFVMKAYSPKGWKESRLSAEEMHSELRKQLQLSQSLSLPLRCGSNQEIHPLFHQRTSFFSSPPSFCFCSGKQRLLLANVTHSKGFFSAINGDTKAAKYHKLLKCHWSVSVLNTVQKENSCLIQLKLI